MCLSVASSNDEPLMHVEHVGGAQDASGRSVGDDGRFSPGIRMQSSADDALHSRVSLSVRFQTT